MAGKKQLPPVRIATEDDVPTAPLSLREAFSKGFRLDELRAKRRILIAHIESDQTLARDLAALMRQDNELSREIEGLEAKQAEEVRSNDNAADESWSEEAI